MTQTLTNNQIIDKVLVPYTLVLYILTEHKLHPELTLYDILENYGTTINIPGYWDFIDSCTIDQLTNEHDRFLKTLATLATML